MKKIKLKESDLSRIIEKVIQESATPQKKKIIVSEKELINAIHKIVKEQRTQHMLGFGNMGGGMGMGFSDPVETPTSRYKQEVGEQDIKDRLSGDAFREDAEGGEYEGDIDEAYDEIVDKKSLEMAGYTEKKTGGTTDKRENLDKEGNPVSGVFATTGGTGTTGTTTTTEVGEQASEEEKHLAGDVTINVVDDPASTADGMGMFESRVRKIVSNIIYEKKDKKKGKCPASGCIKKEGNFWRIISNKTGKLWPAKYDTKKDAEDGLDAYHANK